jgi:hypothetical protein
MARLMIVAGVGIFAVVCSACGAVEEPQAGEGTDVPVQSFELPPADAMTLETAISPGFPQGCMARDNAEQPEQAEFVGEAASEWRGPACRAGCWTIASAGCGAVGGLCAAGTAITVGGVAIPCWVAVATACGVAGGGASLCSDWCTRRFRE